MKTAKPTAEKQPKGKPREEQHAPVPGLLVPVRKIPRLSMYMRFQGVTGTLTEDDDKVSFSGDPTLHGSIEVAFRDGTNADPEATMDRRYYIDVRDAVRVAYKADRAARGLPVEGFTFEGAVTRGKELAIRWRKSGATERAGIVASIMDSSKDPREAAVIVATLCDLLDDGHRGDLWKFMETAAQLPGIVETINNT